MKNTSIGIFGREDDPEVDLLKRRIEDLGARATIIDLCGVPKSTKAVLDLGAVRFDDVDLGQMDAFYLRQMGYFSPLPQKEFTREEWADHFDRFNDRLAEAREAMSFNESLIEILSELKPMVNPYRAAFYHKLKPYQYCTLAAQGLKVPSFQAGNDFFEITRFVGATPCVVKPLVGGLVRPISAADLDKERETLRRRPVLVQQLIKGKALRSFVVGERLVGTCETVYGETDVDSRQNVVAMRQFDLSREHAEVPVRACRALGMLFAGVDMIIDDKSGELYVLECNPAPFFRNFEVQTGLPLSQELARYLVEEATL